MAETATLHAPSRPDWTCKVSSCGQAWPCEERRAALLRTFRHSRLLLRMYMAAHMHEAIADAVRHPKPADIDFWPRFMGWIPRTPNRLIDATSR
ncbi:hypothetical protein JCM9533A_76350 [Catenuloplanes niger JCM 9533]